MAMKPLPENNWDIPESGQMYKLNHRESVDRDNSDEYGQMEDKMKRLEVNTEAEGGGVEKVDSKANDGSADIDTEPTTPLALAKLLTSAEIKIADSTLDYETRLMSSINDMLEDQELDNLLEKHLSWLLDSSKDESTWTRPQQKLKKLLLERRSLTQNLCKSEDRKTFESLPQVEGDRIAVTKGLAGYKMEVVGSCVKITCRQEPESANVPGTKN
ncbi:hypothetical protein BJ742DRAFT_911566 [Cladochytrium replicatum]|nr:hypothetical protein BJ742DRAFT_911566 [Cladochytrium replicatum]